MPSLTPLSSSPSSSTPSGSSSFRKRMMDRMMDSVLNGHWRWCIFIGPVMCSIGLVWLLVNCTHPDFTFNSECTNVVFLKVLLIVCMTFFSCVITWHSGLFVPCFITGPACAVGLLGMVIETAVLVEGISFDCKLAENLAVPYSSCFIGSIVFVLLVAICDIHSYLNPLPVQQQQQQPRILQQQLQQQRIRERGLRLPLVGRNFVFVYADDQDPRAATINDVNKKVANDEMGMESTTDALQIDNVDDFSDKVPFVQCHRR